MANKNTKQFSIGDSLKAQFTRQFQQTKYCSFCGQPVLAFATDEKGYNNNNIEWEMKFETHYSCYVKHTGNRG